MPSLLGTTVTANYNRMVGPDFTVSNGVRTYSGPYSNFGTRKLTFLKIVAGTAGDSDINFTYKGFELTTGQPVNGEYVGTYTDSESYFSKAVRILQTRGEVFFVGIPDATSFMAAVAFDTANGADTDSNVQKTTFAGLEDQLNAGIGIGNANGAVTPYDGAFAVSESVVTGVTWS